MYLLEKIEFIIEENNKRSDALYAVKKGEAVGIDWDISDSIEMVNMFIRIVPSLQTMGFDISDEIPRAQLKNLKTALDNSDTMKVADSLKYEINDTILTLKELVVGGVIKNEELL